LDETMTLALRALRHPQTGLAAMLGAVRPQVDVPLLAVYLAPPGPGPVELLAATGPDAGRLPAPGKVEGTMCRAVRALVSVQGAAWAPTPPDLTEPWSGYAHAGRIATPLPSGGACLLLAGADRPGDPHALRRASSPVALLAALLASSRDVERLRQELHEVRQSRSLLAAGLQHDLRTPLTSILGGARTLMTAGERLSAAERADLLAIVSGQAERMSEMIAEGIVPDNVGPGVPLRLIEANLADVARRAAAAARVGLGGEVRVDVEEDTVVTDGARLERALLNLLDNALKYGPPGQPVHVMGSPSEDGFSFTVADAGPGVSAAIVPTLFSAYATDPNRPEGVGLGLHSVATLAAELGGRVTYARHEGWTRFTLTIPDLRGHGVDRPAVAGEVGV
jgi:signal transduction histidine kinase